MKEKKKQDKTTLTCSVCHCYGVNTSSVTNSRYYHNAVEGRAGGMVVCQRAV